MELTIVPSKDFLQTQLAKWQLTHDFFWDQQDRLTWKESALFLTFEDDWQKFLRSRAPRGPLYRALRKERDAIIWDATCGTGKDTLLLLAWGFKVVAFERNRVVYLLLLDAYRRLATKWPLLSSHLQIRYGNCFCSLAEMAVAEEENKQLVIYYDPMYPVIEIGAKSALPRKEIQILRQLVGEDKDIVDNITLARRVAHKLILKRALHSRALELPFAATCSYQGKNTRYDVFFHI